MPVGEGYRVYQGSFFAIGLAHSCGLLRLLGAQKFIASSLNAFNSWSVMCASASRVTLAAS